MSAIIIKNCINAGRKIYAQRGVHCLTLAHTQWCWHVPVHPFISFDGIGVEVGVGVLVVPTGIVLVLVLELACSALAPGH